MRSMTIAVLIAALAGAAYAADDSLDAPSTLVAAAHAAGLAVHPWTFRAENVFLPAEFRVGSAPAEHGDPGGELRAYLRCGIDGFFTDQPDIGVAVRDAFVAARP